MSGKQRAIIVDLDGTLCDEKHRRCFLDVKPWGKREFDSFYEKMDDDVPHKWCLSMVLKYFRDRYQVVFITGRPEKYRKRTEAWLHSKCGLSLYHGYKLLMRSDGDYRPDTDVKSELYYREVAHKYDVEFVLDDRNKVVDKWREMGLVCLQVAAGDF